jgi:hypothetical protein
MLEPHVASLEGLSEDIAKEYVDQGEGGGANRYRLSVNEVDGWALQDIAGLTSTLGKKDKELKELRPLREKYGDLDPSEARAAIARVAELKDGDFTPSDKVQAQIDTIKTQLKKEYDAAGSAKDEQIGKFRNQIVTLVKTNEIRAACMHHRAKGGKSMEALEALLDRDVKVDFSGDIPKSFVVGPDGETPIYSAENGGETMRVLEHVGKLRNQEDMAVFFEGSGASGAGSEASDTSSQNNVMVNGVRTVRQSAVDGVDPEDIVTGKIRVVPG